MAIPSVAHQAQEAFIEIDTRYGRQVVARSSLLTFPAGLPGFDELRQFKLFHEEGTATVFYLQSVEDPDVRLPVVTPQACKIDYRIELSDAELERLHVEAGDDLLVVVTLADDPDTPGRGITPNLMAPIVINASSRIGLQKSLRRIDGGVLIDAA